MKKNVGKNILRTQRCSRKSVDKNGLLLSKRSVTMNENDIQHYKGNRVRIDLR